MGLIPFLPENLIMIDCEMTNVIPERDSLLQVAMLKLFLQNNQYVIHDDPFEQHLVYTGKPETAFHKKYLTDVFEKCNASKLTTLELRDEIHYWLGDLKGRAMPTGVCVSTDLSFLYSNNCIDRSDISASGITMPGTFKPELFEIMPIKLIACQKKDTKIKVDGLSLNIHDAMVDCHNQLLELNYYLKILLN